MVAASPGGLAKAFNDSLYRSDCVFVGFTGSYPDDAFDLDNEYLLVADAARSRRFPDRHQSIFHVFFREKDFDIEFRKKVRDIGLRLIKLGMTSLLAKADHPDRTDVLYS
jgi:hypothetical protein